MFKKEIKKILRIFVLVAIMALGLLFVFSPQGVLAEGNRWRGDFEFEHAEENLFKEARNELIQGKERNDNKKELDKKTMFFLNKTVDVLVSRMERVKKIVSKDGNFDFSKKSELNSGLEREIKNLKERKEEINGAGDKIKINEQIEKTRKNWLAYKIEIKEVCGQVIISKTDMAISKIEKISLLISSKIDILESSGKNVSDLEAVMVEYEREISLVKQKNEEAENIFLSLRKAENAEEVFKKGLVLSKEAENHLKTARDKLTFLIERIKEYSEK